MSKAITINKAVQTSALDGIFFGPVLNRLKNQAALVYRSGKGCRQYAFETVDDLATWAGRHPYKTEDVRVMPVKDGKFVGDRWMPAADAADFVRTLLGLQQYRQKTAFDGGDRSGGGRPAGSIVAIRGHS